jgi:hypothetical protein
MDTITISKVKYEQMRKKLKVLESGIYSRLLEFEKKITKGKKYSRKDLGF